MSEKPTYEELENRIRELEKKLRTESQVENSVKNDKQVIQTGTPQEIEEFGLVDGKMYTFISTKYPLMDDGGKIYGICGVSSDITERANAKQKLIEKDELFRTAIKHSPIAMVVSEGIDQIVIMINDQFTDLFGYMEEDIPHVEAWWRLAYPDKVYREKIRTQWTKAVEKSFSEQSQVEPMEVTITCKDGTLKEVSVEAASVGEVNLVAFVDMTERKQIEDTLRKNKNRYRTILQTAIDGFWITDINGHFLEVNAAYSAMSGFSHSELLTMQISDIEANEDPKRVEKHIKMGMSIGYDRFESFHRRKDNSTYPVEVNFTYSDTEGGQFVVFVKDISERKAAEDNLLRNQYYLTKAQEIGKIGTWELNIEKNNLIWTDENYKIFGVPLGTKLNYEIFLSCIHPEDRDYVNQKWNEALKNKSYDIMHRVVADNKVKWVREKADIEFDSKGNPIIAVGFTQDLTGLKEIENALQESEKKFKTMFEKAPLSYQSLDENGNFNEVNQTWLDTMGYTRDEVLGKNFSDFLVPDWKDHFKENFPRFKAVGEILGVEFEMVKKDGDVILVSFHGKIAKTEMGKFKQTHCIFQDITGVRQAEESSNRLKERLESLWNITKIADSEIKTISDHVLEEVQKMTQSQYAFYGFLDKNENEMILHAWSHQTMDDCKTNEKTIHFAIDKAGIWAEAVKEKNILTINDFNLDHPGKRGVPDGHVQLYRLMVVPYIKGEKVISIVAVANKEFDYSKDDEKQVLAFLQNVQLLIDRKAADQEAANLATQLQQMQKMESVGRLAGGVAHDFNNMLGVILGHTELALLQADENHDLCADLKEIQKAAKRSADITKQLLAFARKQTISPRQLDLNDTVESMLNMLRRLIGENIDLLWKPSAHLWPVKMDPSQIDQILVNLCVNTRDAIADVGKLTIETGKKSFDEEYCKEHPGFIPGDFVLLSVSDNGCGMDKKTLENLFEPFFTTKDVGKGTGLGLATIYGIVKQNNGLINVYSEPGQGSTFKIYLPRLVAEEDSEKAVPEKKAAAGGTETILLVEDEPSILRMTRMMLERKGYSVLSAATPGEAMEKAKIHSCTIDLLMTDVVMPEMNGRDLAGQISELYPGIRLLFMSGYSADVIAHQDFLDDGVAFIQKPFSMADMTAKVRELLDKASDET